MIFKTLVLHYNLFVTLSPTQTRRLPFANSTLETIKDLHQRGPAGNRWFKVNLHVHGQSNDAEELVAHARDAKIDLIAITDHQSFNFYSAIQKAARTPGRSLTVLPGIEITSLEGCHLLAVFPQRFSEQAQNHFIGWLVIPGTGETSKASRKNCSEIFERVHELDGIVIVPHPFAEGIGAFDDARKMSTREEWLESGHIRLIQAPEDKVKYLDRDEDGSFLNRYVLGKARPQDIRSSSYCLAPFNRSDAHRAAEVRDGCSWFCMGEATVEGLKQVACEPRTRIAREEPFDRKHDSILGLRVTGGYCDQEFFRFSDGLSCVVGQNHSGKSSVFDFIRFALKHEEEVDEPARKRLLRRLHGILKPGGAVELYLRMEQTYYVVKRTFEPTIGGEEPDLDIDCSDGQPSCYSFDAERGILEPAEGRAWM